MCFYRHYCLLLDPWPFYYTHFAISSGYFFYNRCSEINIVRLRTSDIWYNITKRTRLFNNDFVFLLFRMDESFSEFIDQLPLQATPSTTASPSTLTNTSTPSRRTRNRNLFKTPAPPKPPRVYKNPVLGKCDICKKEYRTFRGLKNHAFTHKLKGKS